jgi:predicted nucleic-acid-binding Zn-ribbon protein
MIGGPPRYKITCNVCGYTEKAQNKIEADHLSKIHNHWDTVIERIG